MNQEAVYLLGNEAMPKVYKIGMTKGHPVARAQELSRPTGVPMPFDVLCWIDVENGRATERYLHELLDADRIDRGREFFHIDDLGWLASVLEGLPSTKRFHVGALHDYLNHPAVKAGLQ